MYRCFSRPPIYLIKKINFVWAIQKTILHMMGSSATLENEKIFYPLFKTRYTNNKDSILKRI